MYCLLRGLRGLVLSLVPYFAAGSFGSFAQSIDQELALRREDALRQRVKESEAIDIFRNLITREGKGGAIKVRREVRGDERLLKSLSESERDVFNRIVSLHFEHYLIDDDGVSRLAEMTSLDDLSLVGNFTDKGVTFLQAMQSLKSLALRSGFVTDASCQTLQHLPALRELDIRYTSITGAGVSSLRKLSNLRKLTLPNNSEISDADMVQLRHLNLLTSLFVDGTLLTDGGFEHLSKLKNLEWISLAGTRITSKSLIYLESMPNLKVVNLDGIPLPARDVSRLREIRPELTIIGQ